MATQAVAAPASTEPQAGKLQLRAETSLDYEQEEVIVFLYERFHDRETVGISNSSNYISPMIVQVCRILTALHSGSTACPRGV